MKILLIAILAFYSCGGTTSLPVTNEMAVAIDAGIMDAIARGKCAGYTKNMVRSAYQVEVVKGEMRGEYPVIRVKTGGYTGTEYDQGGGYVFATGYFKKPNTIVVPQYTSDFGKLTEAVANETEHAILFSNDTARYEATKVHLNGQGHPLLPRCQ